MTEPKKKKPATPKPPSAPVVDESPLPQGATFTEKELNELGDFYNLIVTKAEFKLTLKQAAELTKASVAYYKHIQKCEGYLFEIPVEVGNPKRGNAVMRQK
jgi:hypothetical protein